jgi:thioredoxin
MKLKMILTAALITLGAANACGNNNKGTNTTTEEKKATVIELSSADFNNKICDVKAEEFKYLGTLPAIVDFNAVWCGPCRKIAPILEELAAEYDGQIVIYKVDVDKCRDIAGAFNIQSIPAILYIPTDGDPQMTVGSRSKEQFKEEIEKILLKK